MSNTFAVRLEQGYSRKMLFAAEIIDAVTLEPVRNDLRVTATGLKNTPIINYGGSFVWLEEGGRQPQTVVVDASATQYESVTVPAPVMPARSVRIELAPSYSYPFPPGVTALRGTLIENLFGTPTPVIGAELWLQWIDDNASGTSWIDAPTHSHSGAKGDFAALLRLSPAQVPRADAGGGVIGRLSVRREGVTRTSTQFSLGLGRITTGLPSFVWSELVP